MASSDLTLFCMNDFSELGIQRVIVWILNEWSANTGKYGPLMLSVHNNTGPFASFLSPTIPVHELDKIQPPIRGAATPFRVLAYYRLIRRLKPKTVIAVNQFEALAVCLVKRFLPPFRLVVCEHCHVTSNIHGPDSHKGWFGWYYRTFFPREYSTQADIVHTVAHEAAEDLTKNYRIAPEKIRVVYNPVDLGKVNALADEPVDDPWLEEGNRTAVTASRLVPQKRLDILLRAWKLVKAAEPSDGGPPFRLILCGDGVLRAELEDLVRELGVEDSVRFVGFQKNPWKWMRRAALFVSTSEWEGLPCSFIEAQAVGTPVLSSDCPSGPREILMDGEAGYLFPSGSVEKCAETLIAALSDEAGRRIKTQAATRNLERFALPTIVEQYAALTKG